MTEQAKNKQRKFNGFSLDVDGQILWFGDKPVKLHLKEIDLLAVLTETPGEVVTKQELMDRVWADSFVEESNLTRHVYRLRKAFDELGVDSGLIETIPRRGYRFTGKIEPQTRGTILIERRTVTETFEEEIVHDVDTSTRRYSKIAVFAGLALALVLAGAYASFTYFGAKTEPIRSIAVIPFTLVGTSEDEKYLGIAMADLLITRLSNIEEIKVRPTSSISTFEERTIDGAKLQALDVEGRIEGTIVRIGDELQVTTRLVRTADNFIVWSQQWTRTDAGDPGLQNDIAMEIVDALAINLSSGGHRSLTKKYTESSEAMQLYLRGRYHWKKRDNPGLAEASRLFRNAIAADPNFALAYVGIADTQIFAPDAGEAEQLIESALKLDPELSEAYATRGFIRMFHKWKWDEAAADLKRSIELNPGNATAHQWLANVLMVQRRFDEAEARLKNALEIDPLSHNVLTDLCQVKYYADDLSAAEANCKKALDVNGEFIFAFGWLSRVYFRQGRIEEAVEANATFGGALQRTSTKVPDSAANKENGMSAYEESARTLETHWRYVETMALNLPDSNANKYIGLAEAQIYFQRTDDALSSLEKAVAGRAFLAPFINADPQWDPLREHPRFVAVVNSLGLGG